MNKYIAPIRYSDYYRIAFNKIDEGFYVLEKVDTGQKERIDFRFLLTNPAFEKITGLADVIGKTISEVLPDVNDSRMQVYDNIIKTGQPDRFETYEEALNSWFSAYAFPIDDPTLKRVAVIFHDVSDIKNSERVIRENTKREKLILKLSDVLRPLSDPIEIHGAVTRAAMDYFGSDRCYYCEIVGNDAVIRQDAMRGDLPSVAGVYPLSSLPIHKSLIEAGLPFSISDVYTTDMVDEELRQLCIQLKVISYLDVPVIKNGKPVGILCIVQSVPRNWTNQEAELAIEISERTWAAVERAKAEEALAFQASLLSGVYDAIVAVNDQYIITYWNCVAEEMFGWKADEVLGKPSADIFQTIIPILSREESIHNMMKCNSFEWEAIYHHKDGHEIYVNVHANISWDNKGYHKGTISSFRNITERKKMEAAMQKSNEALEKSIEMKDEFLSLISHEFRTPLTVIISAIQMLKTFSWNELSDKTKGYFDTIRQNSNRQLKLVNNILDITRINAGSFELHLTNSDIVQLTKLIIESIKPYAERKKISISFLCTSSKLTIGIDEEKYERVLLNLLSNAIKYTPKGKSVTVKLSRRTADKKAMACIQVCDNGIGIPLDKHAHIFERFGQVDNILSRQAEGTGIGLHLTRMFVEILGGEIKMNSKVGVGSTFTVLLPVTSVQKTHSKKMENETADNRIIQLTDVEFSDIYLDKER